MSGGEDWQQRCLASMSIFIASLGFFLVKTEICVVCIVVVRFASLRAPGGIVLIWTKQPATFIGRTLSNDFR